ncbi:MAG: TetR/AcrR family transcriptional regulator [Opitutaceae bacterium]|nr:TetR/AcrR family transcriptional regulator [Opitutaceae bacterium]
MKSKQRRAYQSPVREAQAAQTRERILEALGRIIGETGNSDVLFDRLAEVAGVQRRTVFRHFENRDVLLRAFWTWLNARITSQVLPETESQLVDLPVEAFEGLDRHENLIRASLHSEAGRELRHGALPERRAAFAKAIAPSAQGLSAAERRKLEGAIHVLYSASAWELLKDYCGMSGREAGQTVSWAIRALLSQARQSPSANLLSKGTK